MGEAVVFKAPEESALAGRKVRVRTLYPGIGAGTELTAYRGSNPYLNKRWDAESRPFMPGESSQQYLLRGWGYEEVGEDATGRELKPLVSGIYPCGEAAQASAPLDSRPQDALQLVRDFRHARVD